MLDAINALILFFALSLLFIWFDRSVQAKVDQKIEAMEEFYSKRVMILPLKESPQVERTLEEKKLQELANETPETHYQTADLRIWNPENETEISKTVESNTPKAVAGFGSGTSSECLDWEEVQLLGAGSAGWTVEQKDPEDPYFSEGHGIDPVLVPEGMKVN